MKKSELKEIIKECVRETLSEYKTDSEGYRTWSNTPDVKTIKSLEKELNDIVNKVEDIGAKISQSLYDSKKRS
jgi:hypothetical protein